ncbi:hypothetical protein A2U01_0092396, partial [Trifolium medium]|nr:hypothetical protein [Trifolium medium]
LGLFAPGIVEAQPAQPPENAKPLVYDIDTTSHFYTDEGYEDRDKLIKWARDIGERLKFAIVIGKSDRG